jgi:poly-gamma-glutamate synthesis protein (capsule biosynthesis protein)
MPNRWSCVIGCLCLAGCAGPFTVGAVGDLQLSGERTSDPLGRLPALLEGDLRLVNLEGPLSERPTVGEGQRVRGRPAQAAWLRGRVDVAGLANNHANDCGPEGRRDTARALAVQSILALDEAGLQLTRRGQRVALIGRAYAADDLLADHALVDEVRRRARRSVVIVSLHWGHTGHVIPSLEQRRLAAELVDAGAALVLGHGPHTPMGVELRRGPRGPALVAYSLGNLHFDCDCTDAQDAFALLARFDRRGRLVAARLRPLVAGIPRDPAPRPSADPELRTLLTDLSNELGTRLTTQGTDLRIDLDPSP